MSGQRGNWNEHTIYRLHPGNCYFAVRYGDESESVVRFPASPHPFSCAILRSICSWLAPAGYWAVPALAAGLAQTVRLLAAGVAQLTAMLRSVSCSRFLAANDGSWEMHGSGNGSSQ
jgi:hypothetical protein